jgi:hypothetical protein
MEATASLQKLQAHFKTRRVILCGDENRSFQKAEMEQAQRVADFDKAFKALQTPIMKFLKELKDEQEDETRARIIAEIRAILTHIQRWLAHLDSIHHLSEILQPTTTNRTDAQRIEVGHMKCDVDRRVWDLEFNWQNTTDFDRKVNDILSLTREIRSKASLYHEQFEQGKLSRQRKNSEREKVYHPDPSR